MHTFLEKRKIIVILSVFLSHWEISRCLSPMCRIDAPIYSTSPRTALKNCNDPRSQLSENHTGIRAASIHFFLSLSLSLSILFFFTLFIETYKRDFYDARARGEAAELN